MSDYTPKRAYVLTVIGGEFPATYIEEAEVVVEIPGYGIIRKIGNHSIPCPSSDVFESRESAESAAAARLRNRLAEISIRYEKKIEGLSA